MRTFRFAAALLIAPMTLTPFASAKAQIGIEVGNGVGVAITVAPPMLPEYEQPPMPDEGYIWTPGYWAYGGDGYYWVPGTWVQPPELGMYWTPGYWGWNNGVYLFSAGYWGPQVGYYGGIDYGYGYGGSGYQGGEWHGRDFTYNRAVNNFGGVHVTHTYEGPSGGRPSGAQASFNGPHGVSAHASPQEEAAGRLGHMQPTAQQTQHMQAAAQDRGLHASVNGGHPAPAIAATTRPRVMNGAAEPSREVAPQRQGVVPLPQHENTPAHQTAPQSQHEAVPERMAAPQPQREAAPAAPQMQREIAPPHQAAPQMQREIAPPRQAPPQMQREVAPPHQTAPQIQHEAAPAAHAPAARAPEKEEEHR